MIGYGGGLRFATGRDQLTFRSAAAGLTRRRVVDYCRVTAAL